MPKPIPKKKSRRSSATKPYLWLVPFTFERPRTRQNGTFQMVVEAPSPDEAMERCCERLIEIADTTTLFKEPVILYSDGLIRRQLQGGSSLQRRIAAGERPDLEPHAGSASARREMFSPAEREAGPVEPFITFGIEAADDDLSGAPPN
jgi:hypothetical protein